MFWQQQAAEENSLLKLIKEDNVTLQQLLDDPYLIQEAHNHNEKLLDFLTREDVLLEMLNIALHPKVDANSPLENQYRHAHVCCEILTSENNTALAEAVLTSEVVLSVITDFFVGNSISNHLVASFYMKIVSRLLSIFPEKVLEILESGNFVGKATEHLHLAGVAELILRLATANYDEGTSEKIRIWFVKNELVESCVSLLDPSFPTSVHNNVKHLWTEIVRQSRDNCFAQEETCNPLVAKMQSAHIIEKLIEKVLKLGSCEGASTSVIFAVCAILNKTLETNYIQDCPSYLLAVESANKNAGNRMVSHEDVEGIPRMTNMLLPDPERVVETVVAAYGEHLLRLAIGDLETNNPTCSWSALMNLFISLTNTRHMPTHARLTQSFTGANLKGLFSIPRHLATMSILHDDYYQIISNILYTAPLDSNTKSPLLEFAFKELDLIGILDQHIGKLPEDLTRLQSICLRGFYMNLAPTYRQMLDGKACVMGYYDICKKISHTQAHFPKQPKTGNLGMDCGGNLDDDDFFAAEGALAPASNLDAISLSRKMNEKDKFDAEFDAVFGGSAKRQGSSEEHSSKKRQDTTDTQKSLEEDQANPGCADQGSATTTEEIDPFLDWPQASTTKSDCDWPTEKAFPDEHKEKKTDLDWPSTSDPDHKSTDSISSLRSAEVKLTPRDEWAIFGKPDGNQHAASPKTPLDDLDWPGETTSSNSSSC
ncbi:unnamed protein product, partial [Mesorhabditis spiculigera]